ncbi:MAG: nucleotidyltransferase domain-containing protein [Anaerolineae bacterium]
MVGKSTKSPLLLAQAVAGRYARWPQVQAVALAGSQAAGTADQGSDIDLYVYLREELPVAVNELIRAVSHGKQVVEKAKALVEGLDNLLSAEGLF